LLSDIFPTGYHGAVTSGVGPGHDRLRRRRGAGRPRVRGELSLLGAAVVIVGDMIKDRLKQAKSFGCEIIDLTKTATLAEQIEQIIGVPEVDCSIDCVGFERTAPASRRRRTPGDGAQPDHGSHPRRRRARHPGLCTSPATPARVDENAKHGTLGIRIGLGWAKSHCMTTGQCPVKRYNRQLMQCILHDKIKIAKAVNVQTISLDDAPKGYKDFDKGAAKKFVIDPHKMVA
jgi:glutathione-independent formaldehyde dehydrogenase